MKKLTLVSIIFKGKRYSKFLCLENAFMPMEMLNTWLDLFGVRRGDTYSIDATFKG